MKKWSFIALCILHFTSVIPVYAKTTVEIWNKSKNPLYIALLDDKGNYILPAQYKGRLIDHNTPIQLQELQHSDRKNTNGQRIALSNEEFNNKNGAYLLISDQEKPRETGWKSILAYKFAPAKDIFVGIKSNAATPNIKPQFGPLKGLKNKTQTGLPLENNVTAQDITKLKWGQIWKKVYSKEEAQKRARKKFTQTELTSLYDRFGLKEGATIKELDQALGTIMKNENLLDAASLSRMQNRRFNELLDDYFDLKELIEGKNIAGPTRRQQREQNQLFDEYLDSQDTTLN